MYRRAVVTLLAVFLIAQFLALVPALERARAAGDLRFETSPNNIIIKRVDENTITAQIGLSPTDDSWNADGGKRVVKFTFKKGSTIEAGGAGAVRDWVYDSANPTIVSFTKTGTNQKAVFDYSVNSGSKDQAVCLRVFENGAIPGSAYMSHKNGSDCKTLFLDNENTTPLWTIGSSLLSNKIKVDNYNGDFGNSLGLDTVGGWFGYKDGQQGANTDISGLEITQSKQKDTLPYVLVRKEKLRNNPPGDIKFVLNGYHTIKGTGTHNEDWFIFQATINSKIVKNLYFGLSDDKHMNFYYATDLKALINRDINRTTVREIGRVTETSAFLGSFYKLLGMVNNFPAWKDGFEGNNENCGIGFLVNEKSIEQTGPKEFQNNVRETIFDIELNGKKMDGDAMIAMNSNCVNVSKTGWLQYWGVKPENLLVDKSLDEQITDGCSVGGIIGSGKGEIGKVFSKLIDCLFQSIFRPMIDTAADLLQKAAGVSYRQPSIIATFTEKKWGSWV